MVKYSVDAAPETSVKAKGEALKIHFKNVVNVAQAVKHMTLKRAKKYLENVLEQKEVVAMNSHKHGRGRHAQVRGGGERRGGGSLPRAAPPGPARCQLRLHTLRHIYTSRKLPLTHTRPPLCTSRPRM